jgi:hypothetical protein
VSVVRLVLRGDRGRVEFSATRSDLVLAEWRPYRETDRTWPGSVVTASEDPAFPREAWEEENKDALRAWVERAHPDWLTQARL